MRITRVTLQNIQTAHTAQYQNTNTNLKMGGSPDKTFFQITKPKLLQTVVSGLDSQVWIFRRCISPVWDDTLETCGVGFRVWQAWQLSLNFFLIPVYSVSSVKAGLCVSHHLAPLFWNSGHLMFAVWIPHRMLFSTWELFILPAAQWDWSSEQPSVRSKNWFLKTPLFEIVHV